MLAAGKNLTWAGPRKRFRLFRRVKCRDMEEEEEGGSWILGGKLGHYVDDFCTTGQ